MFAQWRFLDFNFDLPISRNIKELMLSNRISSLIPLLTYFLLADRHESCLLTVVVVVPPVYLVGTRRPVGIGQTVDSERGNVKDRMLSNKINEESLRLHSNCALL